MGLSGFQARLTEKFILGRRGMETTSCMDDATLLNTKPTAIFPAIIWEMVDSWLDCSRTLGVIPALWKRFKICSVWKKLSENSTRGSSARSDTETLRLPRSGWTRETQHMVSMVPTSFVSNWGKGVSWGSRAISIWRLFSPSISVPRPPSTMRSRQLHCCA